MSLHYRGTDRSEWLFHLLFVKDAFLLACILVVKKWFILADEGSALSRGRYILHALMVAITFGSRGLEDKQTIVLLNKEVEETEAEDCTLKLQ